MKKISLLILIFNLNYFTTVGQSKMIKLEIILFQSDEENVFVDSAHKALRVATFLLNSKEFQDSLLKLDFRYTNHCKNCKSGPNSKERIPGRVILDSIFRRQRAGLTLILRKVGKEPTDTNCFGLGVTCPNTATITSYYRNIVCDMGKELPFSLAYGVHISHEYMHEVGYCHTNHKDDVAEAVGWIAFHFVDKWYKENRKDFFGYIK